MRVWQWAQTDREHLGAVLNDALVVLPVGTTEQHGPHLPAGTDTLIAHALSEAAVIKAVEHSARDLVLTPALPFGASAHHLDFGATLSLSHDTVTSALTDLAGSVAASGAMRLVIVNGHGGNRGPCHSACALAATRHGLSAGYLNYWELLPYQYFVDQALNVPGHAGQFETSLIAHLYPDLVGALPQRDTPSGPAEPGGVTVHTPTMWREIDGYTDRPAAGSTESGASWFAALTDQLADRLVTMSRTL